MGRRVEWAHAAVDDLDAAAEYIHRDSPSYAAAFVYRILETARSLSDLAERGRVVPEISDKNIRELFIHSYRLIYQIDESRAAIIALIHGRREFQSAWDEKDRHP